MASTYIKLPLQGSSIDPALIASLALSQVCFTLDGGGVAITTGAKKAYVRIPCNCIVTGWQVVADISGDIVIDVLKSSFAAFPPVSSIAGTEKPSLSGTQTAEDLSLSTWTASLAEGDYLEISVDSVTDVTKAILTLLTEKVA